MQSTVGAITMSSILHFYVPTFHSCMQQGLRPTVGTMKITKALLCTHRVKLQQLHTRSSTCMQEVVRPTVGDKFDATKASSQEGGGSKGPIPQELLNVQVRLQVFVCRFSLSSFFGVRVQVFVCRFFLFSFFGVCLPVLFLWCVSSCHLSGVCLPVFFLWGVMGCLCAWACTSRVLVASRNSASAMRYTSLLQEMPTFRVCSCGVCVCVYVSVCVCVYVCMCVCVGVSIYSNKRQRVSGHA